MGRRGGPLPPVLGEYIDAGSRRSPLASGVRLLSDVGNAATDVPVLGLPDEAPRSG